MIRLRRATHEGRTRDRLRCRLVLELGNRSWHLNLQEAIALRDDLERRLRRKPTPARGGSR